MSNPDLLGQISRDRALGSQLLFPHRHPQEFAPAHVEILDLWGCADEFVAIEAARQFGKTTLAEEFLCMEGAFGNFHYCLLIGETYQKACDRLSAIEREARNNPLLRDLFGTILARKSIENKMWFRSGAVIQALGWEQELQSFKEGTHRPDRCYLDDPENDERVRDKAAVDASMKKFYLELIPAMDKDSRKIRLSQTRRAEDCMITRFATNPEWLYRAFPVCTGDPEDPATVSNWPARYPMEYIREERRRYQSSGMLSEWLQAYMLQATNHEAKPFKAHMLGIADVSPWEWAPKYAIYDPSRTTNERRIKGKQEKSDRTGKVVVSRVGSKIYVHESSGNFWKPDAFINDLFAVHERHDPVKIAVEKNSLDEWLMQPVRIEMMRRGVALPLVALTAPQDRSKDQFLMGMHPFIVAGDVVLVGGAQAHPQLVAEISNFPQGARDVFNALAYSPRVFSGVPVYEDFSGANIGDAPETRRGETVFIGINASPSEVAACAVVRDGRRLCVAADFSAAGTLADAVKTVIFEIRTSFPQAALQYWVPADTYDQWQRIALVPSLRAEKATPYRGEHAAVARGTLSERIRSQWRNQRQLIVDRKARGTLNALAAGYAFPSDKGGRMAGTPEAGVSCLLAEALECMVAMLDRTEGLEDGMPKGANIAYNPNGVPYVSSNPRARA